MLKILDDFALLVLEDGTAFAGKPVGKRGEAFGELVFSTGMTGYQETITDPSYFGQIVIQTFPHIGNTGVNSFDDESSRVWVNGYVVREFSETHSSWRAQESLADPPARFGASDCQYRHSLPDQASTLERRDESRYLLRRSAKRI